jgi:hypothetical protein
MESTFEPELLSFLNKLNQLDFRLTAFKLMNPAEGRGLTLKQATEAIERYRQFLVLHYLYPDRKLVPDRLIDLVWHECVLNTRSYGKNCQDLFGYFLHHDPEIRLSEGENQTSDSDFTVTCQLLEQHFGNFNLE